MYDERAREVEDERDGRGGSGRRFVIVLTVSILLLFALTVGGLYAIFSGKLRPTAPAQNPATGAN